MFSTPSERPSGVRAAGSSHESDPMECEAEVSGIIDTRALAGPPAEVPSVLQERLALARQRLRYAAEHGLRVKVYEVALDLDMSEFHFARQFRAAYGHSPHVYYDEVRAGVARDMLAKGVSQGDAARAVGLRRPAELRALLKKRLQLRSLRDIEEFHLLAVGNR